MWTLYVFTGFAGEGMPQPNTGSALMAGQMPQYFFTVRADSVDAPESAADLRDDAAAFAFALDLIRAARAGALGGSLVRVRDEARPIVFSIPFLPASAYAALSNVPRPRTWKFRRKRWEAFPSGLAWVSEGSLGAK
jgi:hypothetical protein